jgi:hypothetical protein
MKRSRACFVAPIVTALLLAGCGDEPASTADDVAAAADREAATTSQVSSGSTSTSMAIAARPADDAIALDIRVAYERVSSARGAEAVGATLALLTERCRAHLDLDALSADDVEELAAQIEADSAGSELVDVTTRHRTTDRAEAEVITRNADGGFDGALLWTDVVLEDGHWRVDDCGAEARFVPVGNSIGGQRDLPEPTTHDEDTIARSIEAAYLGTGSAADAWQFLSSECRDVEWDDSFAAFEVAHRTIAADRAADPIEFRVVGVELDVLTDNYAEGTITIVRDGVEMELANPLPYLSEGGRWRHHDCPSPLDDPSSPQEEFEAVGEEIGGN